ncbi:Non-catalytic module family expansin [Trichoderma novae-zelandiae]
MVSFTLAALSAIAMALTTAAAPTEPDTRATINRTGSVTWYNTGLGACGRTNNDAELVVAVSASLYDREHPCGRKIRISYQGRSEVVTVVDRCQGCAENDLDLSPAAFRGVIGDPGLGRVTASWDWA